MIENGQIHRSQIVMAARRHLGTRFQHQARKEGVAIDCVGLLVLVARELGVPHLDSRRYSRFPDGKALVDHLHYSCDRLPTIAHARAGSVLVFEFLGPDWPQHVGIRTDRGMIHTSATVGKVVEHPYDEWWIARTFAALDFRGVV